jgi:anti-sigma regulatory factor (Ser/Thr protein kinase)
VLREGVFSGTVTKKEFSHMNNEVLIEFQGTQEKRSVFLHKLIEPLSRLAGDRIQANAMIMFFWEITKNIYDHAGGKGRAFFEETETGIRFKIEDFGVEAHDTDALIAQGSSKSGNGTNFGIGLWMIRGMANDLGIIDFKVDCSKGFVYSGTYPYETRA